jgi:hypothetical protein
MDMNHTLSGAPPIYAGCSVRSVMYIIFLPHQRASPSIGPRNVDAFLKPDNSGLRLREGRDAARPCGVD